LLAVLEGLAIQARDGATREALHTVIDCVVAGWDASVAACRRAAGDRSRAPS
jgi:hypothetical protein